MARVFPPCSNNAPFTGPVISLSPLGSDLLNRRGAGVRLCGEAEKKQLQTIRIRSFHRVGRSSWLVAIMGTVTKSGQARKQTPEACHLFEGDCSKKQLRVQSSTTRPADSGRWGIYRPC